MYRSYQVEDITEFDERYIELGKKIYEEQKDSFKSSIEGYLNGKKAIDVSSLTSDWFPIVDSDIFISHSSKDRDKAYGLAGWLKENLNLNAFVDSAVWGNSSELLLEIDNKFCKKNKESRTYVYELRNYSTSHVHMILSSALTRMIDNSECVFFLKTPNSIKAEDFIGETNSPWIYSELMATQTIRRHKIFRGGLQEQEIREVFDSKESFPEFEYEVSLADMTKINQYILDEVKRKFSSNTIHPLDALYKITGKISG